jgi:hypothetical protein
MAESLSAIRAGASRVTLVFGRRVELSRFVLSVCVFVGGGRGRAMDNADVELLLLLLVALICEDNYHTTASDAPLPNGMAMRRIQRLASERSASSCCSRRWPLIYMRDGEFHLGRGHGRTHEWIHAVNE